MKGKIYRLDTLKEIIKKLQKEGKRVVFTNGCFDLLHRGHIEYLCFAKRQGDILVVGVNSDESVRRIKGEGRPIQSLGDRMHILSALECVDFVVSFEEDTPHNIICELEPDILVKGSDYKEDEVVGRDIVSARGGRLVLAPFREGCSTSRLINRIKEICKASDSQ